MNKDLKKAINHFLEKEKPSKATLNRMALLAGFQTWDDLHDTFMDGDEEKSRGLRQTAEAVSISFLRNHIILKQLEFSSQRYELSYR